MDWALNPMTSVFLRDRKGEDKERKATQRWRRDRMDAATSPGAPRIAGSPQKLGERPGRASQSLQKEPILLTP